MAYEKFTKLGLTPEKLAGLYKTHTDAQIAATYGVAEITVRRWRRKADVSTLTEGQRKDVEREGPRFEDITADQLRELSATYTDDEIGEMYGRSKFPVRQLREQYGVEAARHGPRPREERLSPPDALDIFVEPSTLEEVTPAVVTTGMPAEERRRKDAERARQARAAHRAVEPVKAIRTFTCRACGGAWETREMGNFHSCPDCRTAKKVFNLTKSCAYLTCGKAFVDDTLQNTMTYCSEECRRRAKLEREGKAPKGGFLSNRIYVCQSQSCGKSFTPEMAGQKFCSLECRADVYSGGDEARKKVCSRCGEQFVDTSQKNNQRSHPACSRAAWGHKPNPGRPLTQSDRMGARRRDQVRLGDGGRLDDVGSMRKYTSSWWGRVSELVFAAYRPEAADVNLIHGNRSPYDFDDPKYGRVDVRSAQERLSPQGRTMWQFQVDGLQESCDHAFLVGYEKGGERVARLWLVPVAELNATLVRMAPSSSEYAGGKWDVTPTWGTMVGDSVLARVRALPDPVKPETRFAWVADPANFTGTAPTHRGRRGEFLYKARHPDSVDMNEREGIHAAYDFEDADGTRVNVKTSRRHERSDRPGVWKWSFSILIPEQALAGHKCDVYSCLCLDETGTKALKELRVPVEALGARRLIHVYDRDGDQWQEYEHRP